MNSSIALTSLCVAVFASLAPAQQVLGTQPGQMPGDRLGTATIVVPDQDGDGVQDLAVGAPGFNGQGAVFLVSGQSMGNGGIGTLLWILVPPGASFGSGFGTSIALVGDLNGDAVPELVVGAPYYTGTGSTTGAVYVIDGATKTILSMITGYPNSFTGRALAAVGDQNGDGLPDLILTTSPSNFPNLRLAFLPGTALLQGGSLSVLAPGGLLWGADNAGENLTTGFDQDHDGRLDFAIGAPMHSLLHIYRGDGSWDFLGMYYSFDDNERACASISVGEDYDGDGWLDFLIGAPNWDAGVGTEHGRVIVVSGASILTPHYPPTVITTLTIPEPGPVPVDMHFGASVCASPDLTGDGVGEILVGAPAYHTVLPFGPNKGAVSIFSGKTMLRIGGNVGANNERLGDVLVGGFEDLNGDGFLDFAVAGSLSDVGGAASGVVKCLSLYPAAPSAYCTGKTNTLGCVPSMSWSGVASASSASPFLVTCADLINQKSGLCFYSHGPAAVPFQGGFRCVETPTRRTPQQNSGGSTVGSDCSGTFAVDFNARIQSGVDASLVPGAEIFAQFWSRDPGSATATNLSNALRFLINP